jgi:hypothetical protein
LGVVDNKDGETPKTRLRAAGVMLSMPARVTAFTLGLAGLGAGGVAVFISHLEAGPVCLLLVGLTFMIIALGGTLPSRLKVGDNEATWEVQRDAVEAFVERVADKTPIESQAELLDALDDLAENVPSVAGGAVNAIRYELMVREEIHGIIQEMQASTPEGKPIKFSTEVAAGQHKVDAVLEGPTGRLVAIEIKYSVKALSSTWVDVIYWKLDTESRAWRGPGVMLLITREPLTRSFDEQIQRFPNIHHVTYRGPEDRERLKRALANSWSIN